jgi:hypothetical protein
MKETVEIINVSEKDRLEILKKYDAFVKYYAVSRFPTKFSLDYSKKLLNDILIYDLVPSMINFVHSKRNLIINIKMYGSKLKIIFSHKQYFEIFYESYNPVYAEYKKHSIYEYDIFKNNIVTIICNNLIQPQHFLKKALSYVFFKRDHDAAKILENYLKYLGQHLKIVGYKDQKYDRSEYLKRFSIELCKQYKTYAIYKNENKAGFFTIGILDTYKHPHLKKDEVVFHFYKLRENIEWPNKYTKKEAIKIISLNDLVEIVNWFNN